MRIETIALQEISFTYTLYPDSLKASLLRAGQNFPIQIKKTELGYACVDGHKRLSALQDIVKEDTSAVKYSFVKAIVMENARTQAPQYLQNHH